MLPASTTVGAVHLTVADLECWLDDYDHAIGLEILTPSIPPSH